MSQTDQTFAGRFFSFVDGKVEGPFDLLELAAQLKYSNIDGDTLICREGTEEWSAFRDLEEFTTAQGISVETIARHLEVKARAKGKSSGLGNIPSSTWAILVVVVLLGIVAWQLFPSDTSVSTGEPEPVQAAAPKPPTFAFPKQYQVATTSLIAGKFATTSEVYVDNGKTRTEISLLDHTVITIARPDLGKVFSLHSADKTVTQRIYHREVKREDVTSPDAKFQFDGTAVINGIRCTRFRVDASGKMWILWVDATTHAPVRLVSEASHLIFDYKNFRVGPQDPSLFEPPADYQLIPLPSE